MKKSLLLLASLLVTVASFAQWTKPTPKAADTYKYSVLADSLRGDTTAYYLYNKEAKAFLTQGNAWGTQASIANKGLKFLVSKYIPTDEAGEALEWDGKTVLLTDYCESKSNWYLMFIDSETASFVDRGSQANYFWEIENAGNGVYRILGADLNPDYNSAAYGNGGRAYFGMSYYSTEETTAITPLIDIAEDQTAQIDWQFVTEEDYAAYLEGIEVYEAAEALLKKIEQVKANPDYASISTAEAEAIYANTSSTLEALKTAERKLGAAIKNIEFGGATEENPMDATKFLVNPNFDSNTDGWTNTFVSGKTGTNIGHQGASYDNGDVHIQAFIEAWANSAFNTAAIQTRALGVGEISQTVMDMPQGKYKFTVDAISNNQDGKEVHGVELFAKGGDLNVFKKVVTGNGAPEHFEITFVNDGDEITMGVRTTEECTANWIALDNFTLTYYGPTTKTPEELALETAIAAALEAYPADAMDELVANKADKDALVAAIEAGQSATEDFAAATEAIEAAQKAVDASAKAYAAYVAEVNKIRDYLAKESLDCEEGDLIADYTMEGNESEADEENPYGSADYILTNLEPTAEQIAEETTRIEELFKLAIANSLYEGKDCTNLLTNADFRAGDSTGWTVNVNPTNFAWTGGILNVPVCESWHSYFDISQEVEAPDGIYAISLNGFCRLDDGVDSEVPAEVYINNFSSKLQNLNGAPISEEEAIDGFNAYLTNGGAGAWTTNPIFQDKDGNPCGHKSPADNTDSLVDGGYVPNGMEGASVAFSAGRYQAVAYGLCEGGKLTIGVRNRVSTHVWALWGNFKLTYMAKNFEALQSILPTYVEQLTTYVEENADNLSQPAQDAAGDAQAKAAEASDGDEMYEALILVNNALVAAKANKVAVDAFKVEEENLGSVLETYPNADMTAYNEIADEIANWSSLQTEEVNTLVEKMKNAEKAIIFGSASADEPADVTNLFIVNPRFDNGNADGWKYEFAEVSNIGFQSNSTYTGDEVTLDQFIEGWRSGNAPIGNGAISQEIAGLPAGQYTLAVDAIANLQTEGTAIEDCKGIYLFVAIDGDTIKTEIATGNGAPQHFTIDFANGSEESSVVIGIMAEDATCNWIAADNWTLVCRGTDTTAINNIISNVVAAEGIYNVSGARIAKIQKGLNIVKMTNGSVKKIFVK